ncbi:MAG: phytanoyl-CoA dioxygenase family protein [Armatimonadetes bacterium]|nr:phytanoyl-CoA dioxygenase family protein [Armatimonadota bacterium]
MEPSTLPDLSGDYVLVADAVAAYRREGHVTLRGLCAPGEIAPYAEAIRSAVRRLNSESRPLAERDTYGKAFLQTMNLWRDDAAVARFTLARRFAKVAAELMGVPAVRLYHDQALFKEAGGGHTPWHQDQFYWPLECKAVTMWMPLVDADTAMGTMSFASGSQVEGYMKALKISDESEQFFADFIHAKGYQVQPSGLLKAGDATFHDGWVLHAAGPNTSDRAREAMTIIYFEDGAKVITPDHPNRENDLKTWFPGLAPGDFAASDLNPVVYSR